MTGEKSHLKQPPNVQAARRWRGFGPWAMVSAFSVAGLLVTLMSYLAIDVTIQNMVREEYERVTQSTVRTVARGLSDMEYSVRSAAAILSIARDIDSRTLPGRLRETVPQLDKFDQVLWMYPTPEGPWKFTNITLRDNSFSAEGRFSIKPDQKLLAMLRQPGIAHSAEVRLLTNFQFNGEAGAQGAVSLAPFALVKALGGEGQQEAGGFLIAVGTLGSVMEDSRVSESGRISHIAIRQAQTGYAIYTLDRKMDSHEKITRSGQVYEFTFGDSKWEVQTEFMKEQQIRFLEAVPFFIAIFGLILTAIVTLYVHSHQKKSLEVEHMYTTLEEKNTELESEIARGGRLNRALQRAEQDNRAIIDAVSDIIFETDMDGKILFLSARWRSVTGFDPEQSKGLDLFKMLHPQDQDKMRREFDLMIRGQKPACRAFTRLRTSDGLFRAVELAVSMIRQDRSNTARVVGTFTDVEERRRAERALAEAEKKYRTIVENAAGGIFQMTPEGLYLSVNPAMARILGYDDPEAVLMNIKNANESVYADSRERHAILRELDQRGAVSGHETEIITREGRRRWVSENIRAVRDESGSVLYFEGSMEDVTDRKTAESALRNAKIHSDLANRAKSEFLTNMSHELRTPLNSIIGFSEIIRNQTFGPVAQPAYLEYARDIYESGHRLLNIINEILDISKIEAGERYLNEGVVNVAGVVGSCLDLLSNKIESNKMVVSNTLKDVPNIVAEERAIKQVFMNLLSNAIKFTPSGGRITISSETAKDGSLRVSITDTGIGLDEEEVRKALSPFGQIDSNLSRRGSGTGLGLTLVDALIKLHGGELELFSEKGIGTTATIVIPVDRVTVQRRSKTAGGASEQEKV